MIPRVAWPRRLAPCMVAAALALGLPGPARAQDATGAQSVEELKAALAELRRRLDAREEDGATTPAEQRLSLAQRQLDRLVAAMTALRRERDGLRRELGAARAELAEAARAEAEAGRRLAAVAAERDDLRRELAATRALPPPLAAPEPEDAPAPVREVVDGAAFVPGRADVTDAAEPRLAAIAALIRARPEAPVQVVGYTDASGDARANRALSLARAEAVRTRLAALLDAAPERFTVEGRGEAEPIADDATAEGRRANRRVVVTVGP